MKVTTYGEVFQRFARTYAAEFLAQKVTVQDIEEAIDSGGFVEDLYRRGCLARTPFYMRQLTNGQSLSDNHTWR